MKKSERFALAIGGGLGAAFLGGDVVAQQPVVRDYHVDEESCTADAQTCEDAINAIYSAAAEWNNLAGTYGWSSSVVGVGSYGGGRIFFGTGVGACGFNTGNGDIECNPSMLTGGDVFSNMKHAMMHEFGHGIDYPGDLGSNHSSCSDSIMRPSYSIPTPWFAACDNDVFDQMDWSN